jgi:hypothetical protein
LRYRAELLLLLCGVACGGNTVASHPEPAPQPEPTAGTGSTSETPNAGGAAAEPIEEPICAGPQPVCLPDCTSADRTVADCVAGLYQCPEGWVDLDSCPKDACARRASNCCAPTGETTVPECAADGSIGECPEGFAPKGTCVPEGLGIEDCSEIMTDDACSSEQLVCRTDRCGRNCFCLPDPSGALHWNCWVNLC